MTPEQIQALIEERQVVVLGSDLSDTRRIEQVLQGQFDDIHVERLDLQSEENRAALKELQRVAAWSNLPMVYINGDMIGGEWELTGQQQLGINSCGRSTHGLAKIIGYSGLLPLAALAVLYSLTDHPQRAQFILDALISYSAIILGFVGAIHWGRSLHEPHMVRSNLLQIISMVPVLMAWMALLVPAQVGLGVLIVGFVLIYLFDRLQYADLLWMQQIRFNLTLGVLFSLVASLLSAFRF